MTRLEPLNAIPVRPRHTRLRPPTSGENIEQSRAVLSLVVVCCRQVNPQRTRRVVDLDGRIQNRRTEDPERLLGTAEAEIGAPGPWIEGAAVRGTCGLG
jgi:hypothetical protein